MSKENEINKYLDYLTDEINVFFDKQKNEVDVESIYFWWWTPSLLSVEQISRIINVFETKWNLSSTTEITLECNPENLSSEYLEELSTTKINRLSIWIQSLNENTLREIWRSNKTTIINALENIYKTKYNNVWVDFIIWLPHENKLWVSTNIKEVLEKYDFIKHISVYFLEWNYPEKWRELWLREEEYLDEYIGVKNSLEKLEINRYEISNFAKKWYKCKHNKSYWNHSEYRWFWVSAASFIADKRFSNSSNFIDYYNGKLWFEEVLDKEQIQLEKLMFGIRTIWIDINKIKNTKKMDELIKDSLIKIKSNKIILTNKWILISDYILKELI